MDLNKTNKIRSSVLDALKTFIENEFSGNKAAASKFLGEDPKNFHKYLSGERAGLDKLIDLLEKTKKYEFSFKIKKR